MSKGYKNLASQVAYFIDFNFAIFAMFKTVLLLIAIFFQMSDTFYPIYAHTYDYVLLSYVPVALRTSL